MTVSITQATGDINLAPAAGNTCTFALTTVSGNDLIVCQIKPGGAATIAAVRFGGIAMTLAGTAGGISTYLLAAPTIGASQVEVDLSIYQGIGLSVYVASGADQTTPLGTVVAASGNSITPSSGSVTCPAGGAVLGMQYSGFVGAGVPTAVSGTTLGYAAQSGSSNFTQASGTRLTTGAISFNLPSANTWNLVAYPINAAAGGGSPPVLSVSTGSATGATTGTAGATTDTASGTMYALARIGGSAASAATIVATGTSLAISSTGAKTIALTGLTTGSTYVADICHVSGGNSNVVTSPSFTPTAVAATATTLTGPSSGAVGVASTNFTVGANGTITGTVVVTPSDSSGGGTFTPTTVSISAGTPTGTFTYTPGSAGAKTISTTNNGGLANPTSIAYTSSAPGSSVTVAAFILETLMFKNTASKIAFFATDSTGLPKTGDAANITAYISKDHGAVTALADTTATEVDALNAKGWYLFDVAASESNANEALFTAKSLTSGVLLSGRPVHMLPPNFSALNINATGAVNIQSRLKSGQAFPNYRFLMTSVVDNTPMAGLTVTVTRALDGGAQAAGTISAVTEIGGGEYRVDLGAGDLTGLSSTLRITATGAQSQFITLYLEP